MSNEKKTARAALARVKRKLAAILHADVHGYSRLIEKDEVGTLRVLTPYLEMMRGLVQQHGGHPVGSRGDSLLAEFPSVLEAVQCAVELQHELKTRNAALPPERQIHFRMGINLGEVVSENRQLHGDGINIAQLSGFISANDSAPRVRSCRPVQDGVKVKTDVFRKEERKLYGKTDTGIAT